MGELFKKQLHQNITTLAQLGVKTSLSLKLHINLYGSEPLEEISAMFGFHIHL